MKKDYFKYILALLLFGSNGVVASFIALDSYEIVFLRSLFGGIFLLALFLITGHKFTFTKHKKDFILIVLSGIAMALDWLLLFEAYARIGISLGMLINYTGPIIVIALSPLIFKEKITVQKITALIIAITGFILVSGQAVTQGLEYVGIICAILSAISYAIMIILNKKAQTIVGMENSVIQLITTLVVVAIYTAIKQNIIISIPTDNWLPILWLGVINTGASCYLYFSSIGKLPVQTVAICGYLEPVAACVFSAIILGERMGSLQIIGAGLIIGGAVIAEVRKRSVIT